MRGLNGYVTPVARLALVCSMTLMVQPAARLAAAEITDPEGHCRKVGDDDTLRYFPPSALPRVQRLLDGPVHEDESPAPRRERCSSGGHRSRHDLRLALRGRASLSRARTILSRTGTGVKSLSTPLSLGT